MLFNINPECSSEEAWLNKNCKQVSTEEAKTIFSFSGQKTMFPLVLIDDPCILPEVMIITSMETFTLILNLKNIKIKFWKADIIKLKEVSEPKFLLFCRSQGY